MTLVLPCLLPASRKPPPPSLFPPWQLAQQPHLVPAFVGSPQLEEQLLLAPPFSPLGGPLFLSIGQAMDAWTSAGLEPWVLTRWDLPGSWRTLCAAQ